MATLIKIEPETKLIADDNIVDYLVPEYIYIPIGDNEIKLTKNQYILKEEEIFDRVYSSVSGNVIGITKMLIDGNDTSCLVIENDYCENVESIKGNKKNIRTLKKSGIIDLIKKIGFDEKYFKGKTLLISGIDQSIYENNYKLLINMHVDEILDTIDILYEAFKYKKCILAIKNSNNENVTNVMSHQGVYPNIEVMLLSDLYPLGHKDVLIDKIVTNNEEVTYFTVEDILIIYNKLKRQKITTEKIVTFSGDLLDMAKNINVKLYSSIKEIISNNLNLSADNYQIIINGLLGGYEVDSLDLVVTNDIRSIFIKKAENIAENKCINCGLCMKMCPVKINPRSKFNQDKCIKCGVCNYICPAKINLK